MSLHLALRGSKLLKLAMLIRVTDHPSLSRTSLVLALKAPHPWNPLTLWQTGMASHQLCSWNVQDLTLPLRKAGLGAGRPRG